jgi:hypothetical protein
MSEAEIWSIVISAISLLVAAGSAFFAYRNRKTDIPFDVASTAYDRYYEMNRIELENPHLTHMFVTFDRYEQIKALVGKSVRKLDDETMATYLLQERAIADFILSFYEQLLGQWESTQDKEHDFVNAMIAYFESRLLRNPRLIWWWMADAGGLESSYEKSTRERWTKNVLEPFRATTQSWCDAQGPFGIEHKAVPSG